MSADIKYSDIERLVDYAIKQMIREARGTCIMVYPKKIAKRAGLSTKPVILSLIDYRLQMLKEKGLIKFWKRSGHAKKYIIPNTSPLWKEAKGEGGKT